VETQLGALDAAHVINNKLGEAHSPKLSSNPRDVDTTSAKRAEIRFRNSQVSRVDGMMARISERTRNR